MSEHQVCPGLVSIQSCTGVREILSPHGLEGAEDRCQLVGFRMYPRLHVSSENVVTRGVIDADQCPGVQGG